MTILVTGATGAIGRHLVSTLATAGHPVRAVSRTPGQAGLPDGVEVAGADLADPSTLTPDLFRDVDRMFVFPAAQGIPALVEAAVGAGVKRFVVLSSLAAAAEFPRDLGSASYVHHRAVEEAVVGRAPEWSVLRPGTFANNLLAWGWTIKSGGPVRAPFVRSAQAPIHEADIADAAAVLLTEDGHAGEMVPLTGPQSLTRVEQVAAISAAVGRDIELVEISPEEFRAETGRFVPEEIISMLLRYWSDTVIEPDRVRSGVTDLTGRPGRTLHEWAVDHRADFVG